MGEVSGAPVVCSEARCSQVPRSVSGPRCGDILFWISLFLPKQGEMALVIGCSPGTSLWTAGGKGAGLGSARSEAGWLPASSSVQQMGLAGWLCSCSVACQRVGLGCQHEGTSGGPIRCTPQMSVSAGSVSSGSPGQSRYPRDPSRIPGSSGAADRLFGITHNGAARVSSVPALPRITSGACWCLRVFEEWGDRCWLGKRPGCPRLGPDPPLDLEAASSLPALPVLAVL